MSVSFDTVVLVVEELHRVKLLTRLMTKTKGIYNGI